MLCTDYDKMCKEIGELKTPEFTLPNVHSWTEGLKALVYENVNTLIKQVFKAITEETYRTGGSYNSSTKKKRNNNGIDPFFILSTSDCRCIWGYYGTPTITDDLEKVCWIVSGLPVPDITCKEVMRSNKTGDFQNEYFRLKVCHNGNTHYWLNEDIRKKLNLIGSGNDRFGENIKIKIFEKRW